MENGVLISLNYSMVSLTVQNCCACQPYRMNLLLLLATFSMSKFFDDFVSFLTVADWATQVIKKDREPKQLIHMFGHV